MSDRKITYQEIVNAIAYFRKYGISGDDLRKQMTPEQAQDTLNTITQKDLSHGSSKETSGSVRPHKE